MPLQPNLRDQAIRLAKLPYAVEVSLDETTDGQSIYLARTPELEGCMGQGDTPEDAVCNLFGARVDYIQSLLEDGLEVPLPEALATVTASAAASTVRFIYAASEPRGTDEEQQSRLYEAALIPLGSAD
jgi:predicted RNase H-like HicB family nuclease